MPLMLFTSTLLVPSGAFVQPLRSVTAVNPLLLRANDAPSSEVKHWALLNSLLSASTQSKFTGMDTSNLRAAYSTEMTTDMCSLWQQKVA